MTATRLLLLTLLVLYSGEEVLTSTQDATSGKLVLVQVVARHGDRGPDFLYKNDPYKPSDFPEGFGGLSAQGKQRMLMYGNVLRRRYLEFLGKSGCLKFGIRML